MSVAVVRKLARHLRLPFTTSADELRDNAEMTPDTSTGLPAPEIPTLSRHLL